MNLRLVTNDGVIPKAIPMRVYIQDRVIQELVFPLETDRTDTEKDRTYHLKR